MKTARLDRSLRLVAGLDAVFGWMRNRLRRRHIRRYHYYLEGQDTPYICYATSLTDALSYAVGVSMRYPHRPPVDDVELAI